MSVVAGGQAALRWVLVAAVAVVATGACRGGTEAPSAATVPDVGPTTTVAPDDWSVPAVIDAAYVERVLAELDRIDGEAARIIVAEGELVPAAVDRMRAIYGTDELNRRFAALGELIADDFAGMKIPPGNRRTTVEAIVDSSQDCLLVDVRRDLSAVAANPPDRPRLSRMLLHRSVPRFDPHARNPTGWSMEAAELVEVGTPRLTCD